MAKYKCKHCGQVVEIKSDKQWVRSYCEGTGKNVHLIKLARIQIKEVVMKKIDLIRKIYGIKCAKYLVRDGIDFCYKGILVAHAGNLWKMKKDDLQKLYDDIKLTINKIDGGKNEESFI